MDPNQYCLETLIFCDFSGGGGCPDPLSPSGSAHDNIDCLFRENGEWILTDTNTEFHHLADTVGGVTHYFPQLDFNLFIRRRPAFYILNRILPVILSSFLVIVVFILPCESGEKVSYALTELLALAFLLTLITDYMPSTSLTISILGIIVSISF